jgi:hypothetical protein
MAGLSFEASRAKQDSQLSTKRSEEKKPVRQLPVASRQLLGLCYTDHFKIVSDSPGLPMGRAAGFTAEISPGKINQTEIHRAYPAIYLERVALFVWVVFPASPDIYAD